MAVYYNENNPRAAAWLRLLIEEDLIPAGDVDERSIEDVRPNDLRDYAQCHFFAGIAGWPLALRLAGWPDDRRVWTGSCPCQPFSAAGKGGGFADDRHLWPAWAHLIREHKPAIVFGEQVASAAGLEWFDLVSVDLEAAGYAVGAADLCAAGVGAPHIRQRLFWVAYSLGGKPPRWKEPCRGPSGRMGRVEQPLPWDRCWQEALRELRGVDDGLSYGVAITDGFRNAIVPPIAKEFIGAAMEALQ